MMKKRLSLLLAMVFMFSLVACSTASSDTDSSAGGEVATDDGTTEAKTFTVGYNNWFQGSYSLDILEWAGVESYEALGMEVIVVNDEANLDKAVSNVQNLIAQGVDMIDFFAVSENVMVTVGQLCLEAEVPFIMRDAMPGDPDIYDEIVNNPYFIGFVGANHIATGEAIAELVIEAGYTQGLVMGVDRGNAGQDGRIAGFVDACEAAGITIMGEARPDASSMEDITTQVENLVTANQGAEFIYSAHADPAVASLSICDTYGMSPATYVCDISPTGIEYMSEGAFTVAQGAMWAESSYVAAMAYNYLNGTPILDEDGNPPVLDILNMIILSNDQESALYDEFWVQEYPHSVEYIQNLCYEWNPDLTYDDFVDAIADYSMSTVLAEKMAEGKVDQATLTAAGIE